MRPAFGRQAQHAMLRMSQTPARGMYPGGPGGAMPEFEYQVRVGAVIRTLRDTLPEFMDRALVATAEDAPDMRGIKLAFSDSSLIRSDAFPIYHDQIHFRFCPPLPPLSGWDGVSIGWPLLPVAQREPRALPDERGPGPSFSLRGRRTYLASARVLRATLKTLFANPTVILESMVLVPSRSGTAAGGRIAGALREGGEAHGPRAGARDSSTPSADELIARLRFRGTSRVSQSLYDYTMLFRYRFDRGSGTIYEHIVDKMAPMPGRRVWEGLANLRPLA